MTDPIYNGDTAEYTGPQKALRGQRCVVDSYTPTGKRVRAIFGEGGLFVRRLVSPANLKRLGGGNR